MPGLERMIFMASTFLRHCTITDLFLLVFGLIVFFVTGFTTLWFVILICVFILAKAHLRSLGVFSACAVHGPPGKDCPVEQNNRADDDDWDDDDDGVATGLYD